MLGLLLLAAGPSLGQLTARSGQAATLVPLVLVLRRKAHCRSQTRPNCRKLRHGFGHTTM